MIICIPVTPDGMVGGGFGRADRVALASVSDGAIAGWTVHEVGWGAAHDLDGEGSHHARIARFLLDNRVEVVVASHMGEGMVRMLGRMGLAVHVGAGGDAHAAVAAAVRAGA